jgi:uncharacterized membrane protein
VDQRITDNIEVIALTTISGLLFVDVFLDVSGYLPDGWFHLLLGIFLLTIGVFLFINRDNSSEE